MFGRKSDSPTMILTCPQCATGYFVDDGDAARAGGEAACAACGARWTMLAAPAAAAEASAGKPAAAPADAAPAPARSLPRSFRARAFGRRRLRRAAMVGAAWGGAVAGLMFVAGAAVVFRDQVARAVPPTAGLYAAAGLPVNRVGLVIEGVRAEPGLQDGHATLGVTGVIRNVEDRTVTAPPLRVELYNVHGRPVAGEITAPAAARIPAGETRRFAVAIFDPPLSAYNLQVAFAPEVEGRIAMARPLRQPPAPQAPQPGLRGALAPDAPQASEPVPEPLTQQAPPPASPSASPPPHA
jgi:predicted Zn finger-like uncharacterized protein